MTKSTAAIKANIIENCTKTDSCSYILTEYGENTNIPSFLNALNSFPSVSYTHLTLPTTERV